MTFYKKYLKYKSKYITLKTQLAGGEKTAKKYFIDIITKFPHKIDIIKNDKKLVDILSYDKTINLEQITPEILEKIFNKIFIELKGDKDNIDWIIKSYLANEFGNPSSIANYDRFKIAIDNYNILKGNKKADKNITEIVTLTELETYIVSKQPELEEIRQNIERKKIAKSKQIQLKIEGEADVIKELETDKLIIYIPTSEKGSQYYGRETKWCTAASQDCHYEQYASSGTLYIIQSKSDIRDKYQLHFEDNEFMDSKNEKINIDSILEHFDDIKLNEWVKKMELRFTRYSYNNRILNISNVILFSTFVSLIETHLDAETLVLLFFNKPLGNSLDKLVNLQKIDFNIFNQPLGNSLNNLINLQTIIFPSFNQPLGNSLNNLVNLQTIQFFNFNQPLGKSLNNLVNLHNLTLDRFDQPLGNSLDNLINLQTLELSNFDQPLGNSLDNLVNLHNLTLNQFNQPLGNSLDNLVNLEKLTLNQFNQPLGNSLDKLVNLEKLTLGRLFNQPLGNSLDKLVNLRNLLLGETFNQPLGNSLDKLVNLQLLVLRGFNQPIGNSFDKLINLQKLRVNPMLIQTFNSLLIKLPNLSITK